MSEHDSLDTLHNATHPESAVVTIIRDLRTRCSRIIDPELGRSIVDLGMIANINCAPSERADCDFDVTIDFEVTVDSCPLSETMVAQVKQAVESYESYRLQCHVNMSSMHEEKLQHLVGELKAHRRSHPFNNSKNKTKIFAIASGKGGVGKSSITANLAVTFAALGYKTACIDADVYGFSLPRLFGVSDAPTNLNGMLMPAQRYGVKIMSIGMFAGSDRAILWRGPRLQRSLEQFLADVWWDEPDVLLLDLAPGTGDMTLAVAQTLPNAELVIVTTPQISASEVAVRAGLVSLQVPLKVRGVVENMSWYDYHGERLHIFGEGGGERVAQQLSSALHTDIPLLTQIPLQEDIRVDSEHGKPVVLDESGQLTDTNIAQSFVQLATQLMQS